MKNMTFNREKQEILYLFSDLAPILTRCSNTVLYSKSLVDLGGSHRFDFKEKILTDSNFGELTSVTLTGCSDETLRLRLRLRVRRFFYKQQSNSSNC